MGRPRRRHGRGGAPFTGEPNGLQPGDDVGNRRSFKQQQLPPENIGNKKDPEEEAWVPNDDVGNRIDAAPTHEISGALMGIDGRRRRKKGGQPHQRVGRYIVGGVNPVVAGNVQRAVEAMKEADERKQLERELQREQQRAGGAPPPGGQAAVNGVEEEGRRGRRRRRRRRDGREQVDGQAAQEVSERRAQRFFDFEEDDRFEYVLKSDPDDKRKAAHDAVANVLSGAGRDATVVSRVLDDENRPKVIITIDEKGPATELSEERRGEAAGEPLFVLGNAALMSLNYLVNKIVNRYPDDRIRLAILPAADEKLYLESLAEHRRQQAGAPAKPTNGAAGKAEPATAAATVEAVAEAPADPPAEVVAEAPAVEEPEAPAPDADVEEAAPAAKPKRVRATKKATAKKAAADASAEESDGTGAEASADAADDEAAADTKGRKATKKKASAKVSSRSRAASDQEEATGAKKAAKKAATKKAPAKKTASRKKASSED